MAKKLSRSGIERNNVMTTRWICYQPCRQDMFLGKGRTIVQASDSHTPYCIYYVNIRSLYHYLVLLIGLKTHRLFTDSKFAEHKFLNQLSYENQDTVGHVYQHLKIANEFRIVFPHYILRFMLITITIVITIYVKEK